MKAVRTYKFDARSSDHTMLCNVYLPEIYPNDPGSAILLAIELGSPKSGALCPSRLRVNARPDLPLPIVFDEVTFFFATLKQMYQL